MTQTTTNNGVTLNGVKGFFTIAATEITKVTIAASDNIAELKAMQSVEDITCKWYFKNLMTRAAQLKKWDLDSLVIYIYNRINKETSKKIECINSQLNTVYDASKIISNISISVEWTKSRIWGMCPMADVRVCYTDNTCDNYQSGRITGCGYDKESTAIAQALNQCNDLLHAMYVKKEANHTKENRELFGYGSGYGVKPYFEGGVGVSCYPAIFQAIGYEWKSISHGKTFDVYSVEQVKK